jgi:23S rRNA (cytosine1962-C5)-methyltransferase
MSIPRVILRSKRAQPFFSHHPWVFAGAIQSVEGQPVDGEEVELVSSKGNYVAYGLFNSKSKLRVRLYSWKEDARLDRGFFREQIDSAIRLRTRLFADYPQPNACRIVASEADGLSGLIVDRYDRWLAVQITSLAIGQRKEMLAELLTEVTGAAGIYVRTERGIGKLEGLELQDGLLKGDVPTEPVEIVEGSVRYRVDMRQGQKTGFFLDQRANRKTVANHLKGRTVLDCFCYTGGFGLHAATAGATSVESVDISEPALNLARQNAELNRLVNISFVRADVFDHLAAIVATDRRFGGIILDPPKFARNRDAVPAALRGYRVLMSHALRLLEPDGILVMCCCSGLISAADIEEVLAQVAVDANRSVQILECRGQDIDHPVCVTCPETRYLKCFICRVI